MDWFDLNDWILEHHPQVHKATRYLSQAAQMQCWQDIYDRRTT